MAAILPIPSGRTSDYLARTRLLQQIQSDQVDLLRLQSQLSTGRRIFVPSDDPGAAVRAITLQRTLERKGQLRTNVTNATAKLATAESALTRVGDELRTVLAQVLGVVGNDASQEQRLGVIPEIEGTIDALLGLANSQYQDTYSFGGTRALSVPYVQVGNYIEYRGNEQTLRANVEIGQLFDANISGDEVFGGLSEAVRGSVDLNLQASEGTYLSQLNGGSGVTPNGALQVQVGLNSVVVDLSGAHTLGDVARAIEENAKSLPGGADVTVDVGGNGLIVNPGAAGLSILEVSNGNTAQELGIRQPAETLASFGADLNPILRKTSQLSDLAGVKAIGRVSLGAAGAGAGIKLVADRNGADLNNLTIEIVGGAPVGGESVAFDDSGFPAVLTVTVNSGVTSAQDVVDLINEDAGVPFSASVDFNDAPSPASAGQGGVDVGTYTGVTAHGVDGALDLASGLRITNGDGEVTIDTSGAETVEDLLNLFNQPEYGLSASINATGDGIDVRSRRSGADFTIGENGGTLAEDLGIRTFVAGSRLEDFNRGAGAITEDSYFFTLDYVDATNAIHTYRVNLSDDAIGDFSTPLAATVTGSLDLRGSFRGASGNDLEIVFAEDNLTDTHTASLAGNQLTITVGTQTAGATIDIDSIFSSLTDADFTDNVNYSIGDLSGDYTVATDAGATVTFSGGGAALTVADVNSRISTATAGVVTAGIATEGNGFKLAIDNSGGERLRARGLVAERLGFFDGDAGEVEALDTGGTLQSADRNTNEVESVFNTLLRLRDALEANDTLAIGDLHAQLDVDLNRATFARSELGARLQDLDVLRIRNEDEEVQLRSTLSEAIDADLAEVISDFTERQFALQATLQTTASLLQLSVLDFL
ncbi:MAG: hypothetical protein KDA37_11200 [Planctomycetales bacterium]|nr:hypothetical protein [Planctomycetales bacterium]